MDLMELLNNLPAVVSGQPAATSPAPQAPQGPQGDAPSDDVGSVMAPHQFRGMFGLHGGLRNILGTLGDAFLVQQGAHPVYAPRLQQEREANAMQHLQDNPMQAVQALSLVNPEAAREMYHNLQRDQAYAANDADLAASRAQVRQDRTRANISSLAYAANAQTWPAVRARMMQMAAAGNVDIPPELLPEEYSDQAREAIGRFGIAPGTQMTADNLSDYRTHRLTQIDTAQGDRRNYQQGQLALGGRRANTAEEGVGVARDRVNVDRSRAAETERHNRVTETFPHGRRGVPGGGGAPAQMVEGQWYREHGTGRPYQVVHGQKVYR